MGDKTNDNYKTIRDNIYGVSETGKNKHSTTLIIIVTEGVSINNICSRVEQRNSVTIVKASVQQCFIHRSKYFLHGS